MSAGRPVLVTGAGGFVCRSVVQHLLESGTPVIAVDRAFDDGLRRRWSGWGAALRLVQADSADLPPLEVDAAIHGAAVTAGPEDTGQTPEANLRANLDPALALLEWAAAHGARRTVFLSSSAVYRETAPGPVPETQVPAPLGLYAVAKRAVEQLIETLRAIYGRDAIAVRLSNIYGPGEVARQTRPRVSLVARLVRAAIETGSMTVYRDDPARDWTFAPDVGRAIAALLAQPTLAHPLYHVASGQTLTPLQIAQQVQALLPGRVRIDVRAGTDPGAPPLLRRGTLSADRLRAETGFDTWTPFEAGLRQVVDEALQAGNNS